MFVPSQKSVVSQIVPVMVAVANGLALVEIGRRNLDG